MTLTRDHLRRIVEVAHARDLGFVELVGLAELDPAEAFKGANIRGTALRGQDLAGFDFSRARFIGCDLRGADLSLTVGVTRAMLAGAITDGSTRFPSPLRAAFWAIGQVPSWADDWGHDKYGPWVSLRVPGNEVTQRMRWIPPGRFLMGSAPNESGRDPNEDPRHPVTFAQGFWMFETPCTEALWSAVTGRPSLRKYGPTFPIVNVRWTQALEFVQMLNAKLPGLSIGLPTEAQWEYACRARTRGETYAGRALLWGLENRPVLDKIAWYAMSRAPGIYQVQPVALKQPNQWGLHDMLGNVSEWCADEWVNTYDGVPADGSAYEIGSDVARRVVRSGYWNSRAHELRAAYRYGLEPRDRNGDVSFRCARIRVTIDAELAAPASVARERKRGAVRAGPERSSFAWDTEGAGWDQGSWDAGTTTERGGRRVVLAPHTTRTAKSVPEKPDWASTVGTDQYGAYADIDFDAGRGSVVTQRMRLVPPGRFMMGSPRNEPGRFDWEGPRHAVTIGQGFWLFDTPCTQSLWQAVMDDNPSRFESSGRPVETVSFEDVQRFLNRANNRVPGLDLTLPSEAFWEYACRAGTISATYAGPIKFLGTYNAPRLDQIAWYGGNSGVRFELRNGADTSDWPEKQYPQTKAGTHKVRRKAANSWGLYDMLGNVWEWCGDHWYDSHAGAPADGSARPGGDAAGRVARGGSWGDPARSVRAACRTPFVLKYRDNRLGFRCARISG